MDGRAQIEQKKNPREGANILSALTFSWMLKTFWVGYRRELEIEDLTRPLDEHKSSLLGDKISAAWEAELQRVKKLESSSFENKGSSQHGEKTKEEKTSKKHQPSLTRVLVKVFGFRTMLYGIFLAFVEIILRVSQPLFLGGLLQYFSGVNTSRTNAYLCAGGVIMCSALHTLFTHPYMMAIMHMGMKMRVACCSLIYRKTLKLSKTALGETTIGQAVNLLSNDVNRFDDAIIFLHHLWIGPLETVIVTYFLYVQVGFAALIGVALLLMCIPLQGFLGKRISVLRLRTAIRTDERIRLTNEVITGIQPIKMYTWENPFSDVIEKARRREIKVIRSTSYIRGFMMSFNVFTTRLSLFVTLLAYVLADETITAEKVFIMTAYYFVLKESMTEFFPLGVTLAAEGLVSVKRLQNFMMYDEVDDITENRKKTVAPNVGEEKKRESERNEKPVTGSCREGTGGDGSVNLNGCHAKWLESDNEDTLRGINFKVHPGQLVAVVGQVGSGKSSLLNAILKELPVYSGTVEVNGHIAYASQDPWLFAGSVKQNILFGRKMDQRRYDQVVKVCQLKRDFSLLPYGDKTIVGERGISLSGGQRARINFARAVYADAPICLFDDPLSAVDAHVGKHMFEECIEKHLKGKTRILVTHQMQFLRNVDWIVVLKDGAIHAEGTYKQLAALGIDFGTLLEVQSKQEENSSVPVSRSNSRRTSGTSVSSTEFNDTVGSNDEEPDEVAEMRTKGSVSGKTYWAYLRAGGNWFVIFIVFALCAAAEWVASGGDYFIAEWVNMEEREHKNATVMLEKEAEVYERPLDTHTCIYIYSGLTVLTIIITLVRSFSFFEMCMRASINLHDQMFRRISRATMRFFNTNTSGRVLNRFARDMGFVDESLPLTMIDCIQIGMTLLGIVILVSIVNPWLLIPTVVIGFIFYYLRVIYLATSRSVKRLEAITRSPIYNHLNATLQGLATIRSFDAANVLTTEFDHHQDLHSSAWYIFIGSSRVFGYWLDIFCLVYIALVTLSFLVLSSDDPTSTPGGNVGLAITQSIGLTGMFQWGMRQSAELENRMTSVERVLEYSNVESEPPLESAPNKKPKETWPHEGKVEFKNVFLRYSPVEPPVLKNLNFVIKPHEKIGIVGRTGAGKSSLIQALFRLANVEGRIEIDGVETGEIGLHDLRSKISIIPQEPFLFSGSLRSNLDPFEVYTDIRLLEALEEVELKELGLEVRVSERGGNLSVGQRQLVCLARAIVRNNPILVLDEATANIDLRTDELIQKTIRRKFENCTVLTIAHRLNTVMDNDRILLMDAGSAVEFDHPHILLQNPSGFLYSMVQETGDSMAAGLAEIAKRNYLLRNSLTSD